MAETDPSKTPLASYTGQIWDEDAGMYWYDARWYDPFAARFTGEDPGGFAMGDANLNRYVLNSPLNYTDPTGNQAKGLTPNQQAVVKMAGGDKSLEQSLNTLFSVVKSHYVSPYRVYPEGGHCHRWALTAHSKLLDEKLDGNLGGVNINREGKKGTQLFFLALG